MSIDTIRYYMDMELVIPERKGNRFYFTEDTIEDFRWILKLKGMGFSLKEIRQILSLRRISNWVEPQEISEYLMILHDKKHSLDQRIQEIQEEMSRIDEETALFSEKISGASTMIGIPLRALDYLRCPHCGQSFLVEQVQMNSRYLYSGILSCRCGYRLPIHDGIILSSPDEKLEASGDLDREKYKNLPSSVITMLQKSYNFILNRLLDLSLDNKVILETDIDHFFYLYTHFRRISPHALFIITDPDSRILKMYKERIEYMKLDLDIVYLTAGSLLPLKPHCVDIGIDYFSSNYRWITNSQTFPEQILPYLKSQGEILGCFYQDYKTTSVMASNPVLTFIQQNPFHMEKQKKIPCPKELGDKKQLYLYDMILK